MSALTSSDVLEVLDPDATTEKRASWEAFEFTLLGDGEIEVVNTSYENPHDHTYTVYVEGGIPADGTGARLWQAVAGFEIRSKHLTVSGDSTAVR